MKTFPYPFFLTGILLLTGLTVEPSVEAQEPRRDPTEPSHANIRYGEHPRNVLDLYQAESDVPTPLVLYIHGGGFRAGDKRSINQDQLSSFLHEGWSVAAINYRLTDTAPMPAAYLDCARALQFLRYHAGKWNLNPDQVASTGGSAGAGTSMWIAFHDDLAEPVSDDPIARQSTRLTCVVVRNGQSSYDPRFAEEIGLPRPNFERHPFFLPFYGITADEIDTPKAYQRYEQAAPITYLTEGDPPAMLIYSIPNRAVTPETPLGVIVHHPKFGLALKEHMDMLGIDCLVQYPQADDGEVIQIGTVNQQPRMTAIEFIRYQFAQARE